MKPEPKANCSTGILHVKPTVLSGTLRKYNQVFRSFLHEPSLNSFLPDFPAVHIIFILCFIPQLNKFCLLPMYGPSIEAMGPNSDEVPKCFRVNLQLLKL